MKVGELKSRVLGLSKDWDDCEIVLSRDAEGNAFRKLIHFDTQMLKDEEYGDILHETEVDEYGNATELKKILVLWPA